MSNHVGKRVLIVDDERVIADSLAFILNASGYQTEVAYSGEDAVELAAKLKPDVLISDVIMGGISGVEVAIYFSNYLPNCKIILISGNVLTASLLELAGREGYKFPLLSKPIHPRTLISHLPSVSA